MQGRESPAAGLFPIKQHASAQTFWNYMLGFKPSANMSWPGCACDTRRLHTGTSQQT